jgi:hypothetical protein
MKPFHWLIVLILPWLLPTLAFAQASSTPSASLSTIQRSDEQQSRWGFIPPTSIRPPPWISKPATKSGIATPSYRSGLVSGKYARPAEPAGFPEKMDSLEVF